MPVSDEPTQRKANEVSDHVAGMTSTTISTTNTTTTARDPGAILRAVLAHTTTTNSSSGSPTSCSFPNAPPPPPPPPPVHSPTLTASEILPRLYISDCFAAVNAAVLHAFRITHVISVLEFPVTFPTSFEPSAESRVFSASPTTPDSALESNSDSVPLHLMTMHVPLPDIPSADIFSYFQTTGAFIGTALKDESARVLVHCYKGQSRSATIVAAYLISALKMSASDALKTIKAKRSMVLPNRGFIRQLEQLEAVVREDDEMVCSEK